MFFDLHIGFCYSMKLFWNFMEWLLGLKYQLNKKAILGDFFTYMRYY